MNENVVHTRAKRLKDIARELNLEDKVVLTGYVSDEELFGIYQISDVIILPSKIEGFGLTVCEGWLYGKPAIVSSGAGVSELVIDGANGFTFKAGNHEDLAEKLKIVLKDNGKYESFCKETVKKCSIDSAFQQIKDIFIEVMKEYGKEGKLTH
jgi:glycosyltransferase involved in cell wall biosynthesis